MVKLLFTLIAVFFSIKIFSSKDSYKKLLWVISGMMLLHGSIIVTDIPLRMSVYRWLIFSLLFSELLSLSRFKQEFRNFPLRKTIYILTIGSLIVGLFDPRLNLFYKFYYPFCDFTETYFIVFVGYFAISDKEDFTKLIRPILLLVGVIATYGLFNWITKQNPYHELIINNYFEAGTADYNSLIRTLDNSLDRFRATSTFNQTFIYGYVSSLIALFSFTIYNSRNNKPRHILLVGVFCGLIGTFLCFSRTVLLSATLAFAVLIIFSTTFSRKIIIISSFLLLGIGTYAVIPSVKESIDNTIDVFTSGGDKVGGSSLEMRKIQLLGSYTYFKQSPIHGNGYQYIQDELGFRDRDSKKLDSDMFGFESIIYQLMIEQGMVGLFSKLIFVLSLAYFFLKNLKLNKSLAGLGLALIALFLAFSIGTGPLGSWGITMLFIGVIIKTITLERELKQS